MKNDDLKSNSQISNVGVDHTEECDLPTANIIVAGITGTGKSTLINAVFGEDFAKTGVGRPITANMNVYDSPDVPVRIWDTVGLELDSSKTKDSIRKIKDKIVELSNSKDCFNGIHAIWYCINSSSNRYQGEELNFIKDLHSVGVPFIIVLTQCVQSEDEVNDFEIKIKEINKENHMEDIDIVQVCAKDFKMRGFNIEAFGLQNLVDTTIKKLPDFIKGGFVAAQKVSKTQKREYGEDIIFEYIEVAQKGFWDKVPIINVFTTDSKIQKMYSKIGKLYNTQLSEGKVNELIKELGGIDFENGFWGLICPCSKKYKDKLDSFFDRKNNEGYHINPEKCGNNLLVSRLIAYYGYLFMEAIEQIWEELTEEQLRNVELVLDRLRGVLRRLFQQK